MISQHPKRFAAIILTALLAVASLAGCASSSAPSAEADASTGAWTFTDDTGRTVTLDRRPAKVAAFTDYAIGLLSYGIEPAAIFGRVDVASDPRLAPYDISTAAIVGNSYGEIDLEALAAAQPDLIVTGIYPTDRSGELDTSQPYYGFADLDQQKQLEKIAPIVAIKVGGAGIDVINSTNRLAEALGVPADTITAAKEEFDASAADLSAAAMESDVEVTQMYADAEGVYVVKPADEPETQLYTTYGVAFTDLHPDGDYYWDRYSWENAAQMMTGDVLLTNIEGLQADDLAKQPTFADHPALAAGQVHTWNGVAMDYASQAEHMTELAAILRESTNVR